MQTQVVTTHTVPALMNQDEAARILGVSPKWLERDRWAEKKLPYVKIGRGVRYRAADVNAFIEMNVNA
ncbi:helix-turn-helix domain-containing protein [Actibacterium sp. D379-3]